MTVFFIKLLALIFMTIDHFAAFFEDILLSEFSVAGRHISLYMFLRLIGRISYPLFAFSVGIGLKHTKDLKSHTERLLMFAIISQLPLLLLEILSRNNIIKLAGRYAYFVNIMFTFLVASVFAYIHEKLIKDRAIGDKIIGIVCISIVWLTFYMFDDFASNSSLPIFYFIKSSDYAPFGILLPFFIYLAKTKFQYALTTIVFLIMIYEADFSTFYGILLIAFVLFGLLLIFYCENVFSGKMKILYYVSALLYCVVFWGLFSNYKSDISLFVVFASIALPAILLYNGEKGGSLKYLFYVYYPLHLFAFAILANVFVY